MYAPFEGHRLVADGQRLVQLLLLLLPNGHIVQTQQNHQDGRQQSNAAGATASHQSNAHLKFVCVCVFFVFVSLEKNQTQMHCA